MNDSTKLVAWYNYKTSIKKWEIASNLVELENIVEVAEKECDLAYGVMIFNMDDVLNKTTEIPLEVFVSPRTLH